MVPTTCSAWSIRGAAARSTCPPHSMLSRPRPVDCPAGTTARTPTIRTVRRGSLPVTFRATSKLQPSLTSRREWREFQFLLNFFQISQIAGRWTHYFKLRRFAGRPVQFRDVQPCRYKVRSTAFHYKVRSVGRSSKDNFLATSECNAQWIARVGP